MTESHKKQDTGEKDNKHEIEKLFYAFDKRDKVVNFICSDCTKKSDEVLVDYTHFIIGECPDVLHSKPKPVKEYPLTHQQGYITIDNIPDKLGIKGDLGIQIAKDGKVWICIDGVSFLRFKPKMRGGRS